MKSYSPATGPRGPKPAAAITGTAAAMGATRSTTPVETLATVPGWSLAHFTACVTKFLPALVSKVLAFGYTTKTIPSTRKTSIIIKLENLKRKIKRKKEKKRERERMK